MSTFRKAVKHESKGRIGIVGPAGSGKTFTALLLASHLGKRVAVIDTEHGSAAKYADQFTFDVLELDTFPPRAYVDAIKAAEAEGYDVVVIDSLSHAWAGTGGALEMVNNASARSKSGNTYTAWRDVTPEHNRLIDAMVGSKCHIIACMRAKTEYVMEKDDKGRVVPRKVGMAPVQREGMDYEFDLCFDMDWDHRAVVSKTRCTAMDGGVIVKPDAAFFSPFIEWLSGVKREEATPQFVKPVASDSVADAFCSAKDGEAVAAHARACGIGNDEVRGLIAHLGADRLLNLRKEKLTDLYDMMDAIHAERDANDNA